jgi:hypothetical protein
MRFMVRWIQRGFLGGNGDFVISRLSVDPRPSCPSRSGRNDHGQWLRRNLSTFSRTVTLAVVGRAIAGLSHFSIGSDACLRVNTPEQTIIGWLHGWIVFGEDELTLPAQGGTEVGMVSVEAIRLTDRFRAEIGCKVHAAPPAFRIARFSATRANCTL